MNAQLLNNIQDTHLAIWNERSRKKRDSMIADLYTDDIKMYDPNFILNGSEAVSDFIDKVQSDPKFAFKAIKPMDRTQNGMRLFWSIETENGLLTGMDLFILEHEKVKHLYVFIEG